ncbi:2-polyprenyl-3-methyl-5-hydroxy-6-metoxy-1,4-benzoquinol methylase [Haloferula luteola]|uniref:2-polyprenyl-3-methyl-5-hydroxy-6-metoxy-1, 4-benzoquinol methylase n=1 Tax=Haloferula luteola TaxID=595692 RepID=A0A840V464_9BACT|nr:class I SAM-dependent methyltransferase [Haloferula luteola]MBB5351846.1 2-polyprenyl-3-methyl-5-hydroxy-6-metoxy-1,4-benzoquinol methylase [Haloferula luteola]
MNPVYTHIRRNWDGQYIAAKLRSDPLYQAVLGELSTSSLPLLDLGCGLGLLAFYLREKGIEVPIHSLDYDQRKIHEARRLTEERGLKDLRFDFHDARQGLPQHHGNVTILDILQFFTPEEIETLLRLAAARVAPGGKLVIRSGLRDETWRFKATVAGDLLAKCTFWMKAAPTHYPTAEDFRRVLAEFGEVHLSPLWGSTPFNNHLIVLQR